MLRILAVCLVASTCALAQIPTYLNPKYVYTGLPSSSVSSAAVQSLLARQLASAALTSPKRSLATYGSPTATSPSRYASMAAASNPSIVAIPLYVRNQAQKPALFDLLSSTAAASSEIKKSQVSPLSTKYLSYLNTKKSPAASTTIEAAIPYRASDSISQYEKPTFASYAKYEAPKASPSSYEPVRSYELKTNEPGYGDASSVSLLSSSYSYAPSASSSKPSSASGYSGVAQNPRLKAVEYDDNQKSALADFASALENFDLKAISNQDIYDLPAINPPLTRIPVKPKQESRPVAVSSQEDSYAPAPTRQQAPSAASSAYDESRSYSSAPSSGSSYSASEYAPSEYSSSQENSYRPAAESYRSPANAYRASSSASAYPDDARDSYRASSSSQGDSYRASSTSDSYSGSSASYVPAPSSYGESSYAGSSDAVYSSRPSSSYSSSSPDYYTDSSAPRPNPDDPNCPYKLAASSSSNSGSTAEYPSSQVSASSASSPPPAKLSASPMKESSAYETDELDPSKLDLKVVHLPVSVLKRLVGSGELALPSFNKKK